jgi:hypothetical protein
VIHQMKTETSVMDNRDYPCFYSCGNADPVPRRSVGYGVIICYSSDSSR